MKKLILLCLLIPAIFACSQDSDKHESPQIHAIHQHERCHLCGMMVTKYPGPKGLLQLKDEQIVPKFCSTRDMFNFSLQPENQRQITTMMVHDMALTEWESPDDRTFIDAKEAWYVYGTSKQAVMGPAVASFGSKEGAVKFAEAFGGAVLQFEDITLELLEGE